jgi:hypothetical protein
MKVEFHSSSAKISLSRDEPRKKLETFISAAKSGPGPISDGLRRGENHDLQTFAEDHTDS